MKQLVVFAVPAVMALAADAKPKKLTSTISWDLSNDTLRVYGQGEIPEFDLYKSKQWRDPKVWQNINVIEIGEGITEIGKHAFSNFFGYEDSDKAKEKHTPVELYLPLSLRNIESMAFRNLGIRDLILPSRLEVIDWYAFSTDKAEGEDWGTLTIPESVRKIENEAFENRNIKKLNVTGATQIRLNALSTIPTLECIDFNNMPSELLKNFIGTYRDPQPSLTQIKNWKQVKGMPYSFVKIAEDKREPVDVVTDDGSYCHIDFKNTEAIFLGSKDMTSQEYIDAFSGWISIPDEVTYQGETFPVTGFKHGMFTGNTQLIDVTLPDYMKVIPENAFRGCVNLKHVDLPHYLVRVGDFAFDDCKSLEYITIPDTTRVLGNAAFSGCLSLESVILPDGLKRIGDHCFDVCPKLTNITVPDGVDFGHDWFNSSPASYR